MHAVLYLVITGIKMTVNGKYSLHLACLSTVCANMRKKEGWCWLKKKKKNLPGQCVSRSGFLAVVKEYVGEPSSDCGMRGLSTNFAFRRGAGRGMTHTHTHIEKQTTYKYTYIQRERSGRWRETRQRSDRDRKERAYELAAVHEENENILMTFLDPFVFALGQIK